MEFLIEVENEKVVSIQPKPKKGLVEKGQWVSDMEAKVSIQPKPKKGLVEYT